MGAFLKQPKPKTKQKETKSALPAARPPRPRPRPPPSLPSRSGAAPALGSVTLSEERGFSSQKSTVLLRCSFILQWDTTIKNIAMKISEMGTYQLHFPGGFGCGLKLRKHGSPSLQVSSVHSHWCRCVCTCSATSDLGRCFVETWLNYDFCFHQLTLLPLITRSKCINVAKIKARGKREGLFLTLRWNRRENAP